MTDQESDSGSSVAVDAASGGTYALSLRADDDPVLRCTERLGRRGSRVVTVLVSGPVLTGVLLLLHYAVGSFSSEARYALHAAPWCHPVVGFLLAYGIARLAVREGELESTVTLGADVLFDGERQGPLVRVEQNLAERSVTLTCERGSKTLVCREPSEAVELAHAIESAHRLSVVRFA